MTSRRLDEAAAQRADEHDPLGSFVARFERPDPAVAYLDGNSLGRPPVAARAAATTVFDTWSHDLVGAWDEWIDASLTAGDRLAPLLGVAAGQVVVGESTTVALHKAVVAALGADPERRTIVAVADDFPTDRYVVAGVAAAHGAEVRWITDTAVDTVTDALDASVAVLVASAVHYVSAAWADVSAVTAAVHAAGALVVWDCSHATGAVPLHLDADDVDLAVGCTYKYLHGGPGAPAFTYVNARLADRLRQPVHGWFGQRDQFAMGETYDPLPGAAGWRTGTPGILGLAVAQVGIDIVAEAGMAAVRAKSVALGHVMLDAYDEWFVPLGFSLASPRADAERGGHVALAHPDASRIVRAARDAGVIADFRVPDIVRLGPGPLATSHTELLRGLETLRHLVQTKAQTTQPKTPGRVT